MTLGQIKYSIQLNFRTGSLWSMSSTMSTYRITAFLLLKMQLCPHAPLLRPALVPVMVCVDDLGSQEEELQTRHHAKDVETCRRREGVGSVSKGALPRCCFFQICKILSI